MLFWTLPLLAVFARADAPWPEEPEQAPMTWGATDATYTVTIPTEGPLQVELKWRFTAVDPAWLDVPLAGSRLVVERVDGPAIAGANGLRALLSPRNAGSAGGQTITVRGTLDRTGPGAASLTVLPASRQRVIVVAPGLDVTVAGAKDGWLAAADELALTWKPHAETAPAPQQPLAHAEVSTAVWAEPGALITRAVVRWRVVRGELRRFELDVAGLEEVEVVGANLERAVREGDRMVLTPREPVKGTFAVDVRARRALTTEALAADAGVPAPGPRPIASRVERYWTVGRAEDGELVPVGGPSAVPARALPEWARGLSDTPPESFWQGDVPLRVRVARFTPLMGPDTVIERAELVVAAAAEGRALVRTTWHVRNERRQYLHVRPSEGLRPMTARVSGDPVSVLSDGAGGVYVPLEKSVETVEGLLTFPVELTWIAEGEAWAKKGERTLTLPSVDAPIQAAEWEVYLPRGWTSQAKGKRGSAATASEAPPPPAAPVNLEADDALQQAVSAYKGNRFEEAQQYLEDARAFGSTSANVSRLQSNLDVLLGDTEKAGVEDGATRRVRELANAKTVTQQVEQEEAADKARWAYQSGDVDEAERYLEEVIALADDIGKTEQKESAEQSGKKAEAELLLKEVVATKAKRKAESAKASSMASSYATGSFTPNAASVTTSATTATTPTTGYWDGKDANAVVGGVVANGNADVGGAATNENTYVLDGVDIVDPVAASDDDGRDDTNGFFGWSGTGNGGGGVGDVALGLGGIGTVGHGRGAGYGAGGPAADTPTQPGKPAPVVLPPPNGDRWGAPIEAPRDTTTETAAIEDDRKSSEDDEDSEDMEVAEGDPYRVVQSVPGVAVTSESRRIIKTSQSGSTTRAAARNDKKPAAPKPAAPKAEKVGARGGKADVDYDGVQDAVDEAPAQYRQQTEIDFEGLDVSGELMKPQGALVVPQAALIKPQAGILIEASGRSIDPALLPPPPPPPDVTPVVTPEPTPEPTPAPERRAALDVKAEPLTLALPLDGELVRDSAALLPADAWPTLTLPYRLAKPGASR